MKKSSSLNQEYKTRLNQLSEQVDRLERVKRSIFPPTLSAPQSKEGTEVKKISPDISFLEVWADHTDYFDSLLGRLANIVQELEQF